jgi:hypothetical protein
MGSTKAAQGFPSPEDVERSLHIYGRFVDPYYTLTASQRIAERIIDSLMKTLQRSRSMHRDLFK